MYWNEHLVKVALAKLLFFTTVLNLFCDNTGKKIRCFMHFLKKKSVFLCQSQSCPARCEGKTVVHDRQVEFHPALGQDSWLKPRLFIS